MHTYNVYERIGRGGMAEVFLAVQTGLGGFERLVVFKRIAPFARVDDEYVRSFMREARVAATMTHPNIVTTLDVGQDEEGPYLIMEYLSGEPLSYILANLRNRNILLPMPLACQIAASIASALEFVHNMTLPDGTPWRVVHRDVSPSNVMCCYNGQVKLLDFGVAKIAEEETTKVGMVKGKPSYMSPEQVLNQPLNPQSDVFQLGVICWEMLTGKRLFSRDAAEAVQQITTGMIEPPSHVEPSVPEELDRLVMWALEHDVEQRCPSARVFNEWLHSFRQDLSGTMTGRMLQKFMVQTFTDRHSQRSALEKRIRQNPTALSDSIEVIPSITSYTPGSGPPGTEGSIAAAAPEQEEPMQGRFGTVAAILVMATTTFAAVVAVGLVVFLLGRDRPLPLESDFAPLAAPTFVVPPSPARTTSMEPAGDEPSAAAKAVVIQEEPAPAPARKPRSSPKRRTPPASDVSEPEVPEDAPNASKPIEPPPPVEAPPAVEPDIAPLTDNLDPWGKP